MKKSSSCWFAPRGHSQLLLWGQAKGTCPLGRMAIKSRNKPKLLQWRLSLHSHCFEINVAFFTAYLMKKSQLFFPPKMHNIDTSQRKWAITHAASWFQGYKLQNMPSCWTIPLSFDSFADQNCCSVLVVLFAFTWSWPEPTSLINSEQCWWRNWWGMQTCRSHGLPPIVVGPTVPPQKIFDFRDCLPLT